MFIWQKICENLIQIYLFIYLRHFSNAIISTIPPQSDYCRNTQISQQTVSAHFLKFMNKLFIFYFCRLLINAFFQITGQYSVLLPDGRVQTVTYSVAPDTGFVVS